MDKAPARGQKWHVTLPFLALTLIFVVCLIVSNLVEIKTVDIGPLTITSGLILFPLSYIINDCIVEVYGFAKARLVIWAGFAMSLLVAILLNIVLWLPGGADWHHQEAMEKIYSQVPRIMAASFVAFVSGSLVNAYVMSRLKRSAARKGDADGKRRFSVRAILSTLFGEGVDSLIFFPIAFAGILPFDTIVTLILTQTGLKTLYEILILPLTIIVVTRLKRLEGLDTVDTPATDYRWWKIL